MKAWLNRRTWGVLGLSAALMGGLLTAGLTAASADPHPYGDRDRDGIPNRWDGDGIRNWRDRHPNQSDRYYYAPPRQDWDRDRDGIPNWRDRRPNRPDSYSYYAPPRRGYDEDRDGVPNRWDRDRDGDGVPNWRDHHPDDRHRW
jgi:hypothetical protein